MKNKKTSNVSALTEKVLVRAPKTAKTGRPPVTSINPNTLWFFVKHCNHMARRYNIKYAGIQTLFLLHHVWENKRKGISLSSMLPYVDWYNTKSVHEILKQRVSVLVTRGLVEVVGKGRYNCKLYAPTVNALRDMVEMISKME